MRTDIVLTGRERHFNPDEVIVTKTDLKGRITYANRVFLGISQLNLKQAIGAPHSLIRHPDMPRCVFKLLWDRIESGKEIFAYVLNRAISGDHYWVFAHATPSFDSKGQIIGYHSNRRVPKKETIESVIRPLYAELRMIEEKAADRKVGMHAAYAHLLEKLTKGGTDYDRFIFSI
ncbi:MAG TPA: PAS domain-containing protein [Dongiaceae bacterium]|nr:PAS domain-containing protein [Dongiaceae bacterium]